MNLTAKNQNYEIVKSYLVQWWAHRYNVVMICNHSVIGNPRMKGLQCDLSKVSGGYNSLTIAR